MTNFFVDVTKTFLHFVLSPLHWLFWRFPKVYEALTTTIIFWKNSLPTKREISHTLYHWIYLGLTGGMLCITAVIKIFMQIYRTLLRWNNTTINRLKDLE